jgi:hypothetical protein
MKSETCFNLARFLRGAGSLLRHDYATVNGSAQTKGPARAVRAGPFGKCQCLATPSAPAPVRERTESSL